MVSCIIFIFSAIMALLSPTISAMDAGKLLVHNHCTFPVYLWEVPDPSAPESAPLSRFASGLQLASGDCFANDMHYMSVGGMSVKMAREPSLTGVGHTAFEYHLERSPRGTVYMDMSNVDCDGHQTNHGACPFKKEGIRMVSGHCGSEACAPGQGNCRSFYQQAHDDFATRHCDLRDGHDTHVHLCTSNILKPKRSILKSRDAGQCRSLDTHIPGAIPAPGPLVTSAAVTHPLGPLKLSTTMTERPSVTSLWAAAASTSEFPPPGYGHPIHKRPSTAKLGGAIAGGIGGAVLVVCGVAAWCVKRNRRSRTAVVNQAHI